MTIMGILPNKIICCLNTSVEIYYTLTPSIQYLQYYALSTKRVSITVSEDKNIFKFYTPKETNLLRLNDTFIATSLSFIHL